MPVNGSYPSRSGRTAIGFLETTLTQLAHAQIVDDKQGHRHRELHLFFACAVECYFCEFIEQGVGFTVEHR